MITDHPRPATTASRTPRSRASRRHDRASSFAAMAPPALGLFVASPAVVSALSGSIAPLDAFAVTAVCVSVACVLSTVGLRVATALAPSPTASPGPTTDPAASAAVAPEPGGTDSVPLGRIEPARVAASDAIPGTPPPPVPDMEGPLT